jgi:hypothetical protein
MFTAIEKTKLVFFEFSFILKIPTLLEARESFYDVDMFCIHKNEGKLLHKYYACTTTVIIAFIYNKRQYPLIYLFYLIIIKIYPRKEVFYNLL